MSTIKITVVSMIIVCSVALWGCSKDKAQTEQEVPFVMVTQPGATHFEQKSYAGDVQARQQTALAFRVGGQITERYVDVGDQVRVGQVLAKLDVKDAQLQLNAAQAQLESARSAAQIAEDELKRFKQLLPVNAVSRSQYDAVENQYKAAQSNLKQAQSNYDVSRNQTGYNQLIANKNGVITERNIEIGQVIAAGQPAFQLAIAGERDVVIGVPEQAVTEIKTGQDAWVTLWSKPQEKFAGYVREISPAADQSRTYSVKVALREGNSAIQLGQSARVFLMFKTVPQQFFPPSNRAEILVDLKLEEGASLKATEAAVKKVEAFLSKKQGIDNFVAYVGTGSPRFYLPLDQQLPQASFAQFVVLASSLDDRNEIRQSLAEEIRKLLPEVRTRVSLLENGPPVGYPLQFRVSGEDLSLVREWAQRVSAKVSENPNTTNVHLDWGEPSKVIKLDIDQDRARQMGVSSLDLSNFLNSSISGAVINQYREKRELIEIRMRGDQAERLDVGSLSSLAVPTSNGGSVPLAQIAKIEYSFEEGLIWHRNRLPTITVRADIRSKLQPATVVGELKDSFDQLRAEMPNGYLLEVGGTVEESARGQTSVNAGMPLFLAVVMTLLMIQLRSMSRAMIVFLTAPLGIIGVVLFLLLFNKPFGFVAMLGTIALSGMIMRNSLILIDQIEQDIQSGESAWDAIINATVRRCRPIVLTALAAVLAMIPLSRSIFFGPMAVAIMGGLIVATLLTLFFLPALYAQWFKVKKTQQNP
nr:MULTISPECIES: efflux RND transporter permease subunit [unclassified Acinetobacter]